MSNAYVNAPATKLLATNCACCGRSLVDAVSVETGIGPECRKRFGSDVVVNEAARTEANELVALVARRGITRAQAKEVFQRLHALGFTVLAARIAKRFRTTVEVGPSVEELRTRYAVIRTAFCYDNCAPRAFDKLVRDMLPATATPEEFVRAAATVACPCMRCQTSGKHPSGGECFRCAGKGWQDRADVERNRAYDAFRKAS